MSLLVSPDGVTPAAARQQETMVERRVGSISTPVPHPDADGTPQDQAQAWLDLSKRAAVGGDEGLTLVATLMALWTATSEALEALEKRVEALEKRLESHEGEVA